MAATTFPAEDADVETSSEGYARRFAGPVGRWFLQVQARATLDLVKSWPTTTVLDVGGGHAQLVGPLLEHRHPVTVLGSQDGCAERLRPWLEGGQVRFVAGDLLHAPWPDGTFDLVLAFRLLPHAYRWEALVLELGRLASRAVIVDYPTGRSVNAASAAFFGLKKGVEGDTRPFRVFADAEVDAAFAAAGFKRTGQRGQFFFPMALHRALRLAPLSRGLEALAHGCGLTRRFGSPVIARFEPLSRFRVAAP